MENKNYVYYEDFGAVGDGVHDDWEAIRDAHNYANERRADGYAVKAKEGATYLIKDLTAPTFIMTDVDWTGAKFIIDDRGIVKGDARDVRIFHIAPENAKRALSEEEIDEIFPVRKITKGDFTRVNWKYGYSAMIMPMNKDTTHYIRYGGDADNGSLQRELFTIEADGTVAERTPAMFDFSNITGMLMIRTDDPAITIEGGEFTTIANDLPQTSNFYMSRGFGLKRSNTTIRGLKHYIKGELVWDWKSQENRGVSYSGFIFAEDCQNVLLEDVTFTGHRYYRFAGTYDFQAYCVNDLTMKNCKQTNFYLESGVPSMHASICWGVAGSSFCKNMIFDTCTLSRYDAHCGVYNGKLINSKVQTVEIIGGGDILIENTTFVATHGMAIMLRSDYGSTWNGNLKIKNCRLEDDARSAGAVVTATWANHFFGYDCHLPNIEIDNLTFKNPKEKIALLAIGYWDKATAGENFTKNSLSDGTKNENPYFMPEYLKVKNNNYDTTYYVKECGGAFENTKLESVEVIGD